MRKEKKSLGGAEHGKLHRLTLQLEFGDVGKPENFKIDEFRSLTESAISRVLGQAAPVYRVDSFEAATMRGSLLMDGADLHLLWAALTMYGLHFEQPVAFHLYSIHST